MIRRDQCPVAAFEIERVQEARSELAHTDFPIDGRADNISRLCRLRTADIDIAAVRIVRLHVIPFDCDHKGCRFREKGAPDKHGIPGFFRKGTGQEDGAVINPPERDKVRQAASAQTELLLKMNGSDQVINDGAVVRIQAVIQPDGIHFCR